jgi:hypothetical protein
MLHVRTVPILNPTSLHHVPQRSQRTSASTEESGTIHREIEVLC